MSNIFQNMQIDAFRAGINPRTKASRDWFRKKAQQLRQGRINRKDLMKEDPLERTNNYEPGDMVMFFYDAKTKDKLPYWDRFPLVILVEGADKGFYGLNLHYLPPVLRAKLLDALLDITTNKKYDETTRFNVSYDLLKSASKFKHFKPCFKRYLLNGVQSKFSKVLAPEWEIASFLPTAQWQKAQANEVYKQSRKII